MYISSIVYAPPTPEFPYLAVLFHPDGEVLAARPMISQEAGEQFIASVALEIAEKHGLKVRSKRL